MSNKVSNVKAIVLKFIKGETLTFEETNVLMNYLSTSLLYNNQSNINIQENMTTEEMRAQLETFIMDSVGNYYRMTEGIL